MNNYCQELIDSGIQPGRGRPDCVNVPENINIWVMILALSVISIVKRFRHT